MVSFRTVFTLSHHGNFQNINSVVHWLALQPSKSEFNHCELCGQQLNIEPCKLALTIDMNIDLSVVQYQVVNTQIAIMQNDFANQ